MKHGLSVCWPRPSPTKRFADGRRAERFFSADSASPKWNRIFKGAAGHYAPARMRRRRGGGVEQRLRGRPCLSEREHRRDERWKSHTCDRLLGETFRAARVATRAEQFGRCPALRRRTDRRINHGSAPNVSAASDAMRFNRLVQPSRPYGLRLPLTRPRKRRPCLRELARLVSRLPAFFRRYRDRV